MRKLIIGFAFFSLHCFVHGQALDPGTIGSNQQVCYGSAPQALKQTPASGGTPTYRYQWQRSNDNGLTWINIYRAAKVTYSLPMLVKTTMFRRRVTDATNTVLYSNAVTISITANLKAGTIGNNQNISAGTTPNPLIQLTEPTGGFGSYTFRWQASGDGIYWSDIQGETAQGYSPPAITSNVWLRRWTVDASCGAIASNIIAISVNPISMFTSEIPDQSNYYLPNFSFGTEFRALFSGFITRVRVYTDANESGVHQVSIWRQNDQSNYINISGFHAWNISGGAEGWKEFTLSSPVSVEANRNYVVSVSNGADNNYWVQLSNDLIPYTTNSYLSYIRGLRGGSLTDCPNEYAGQGYFRDVVFVPLSSGTIGTAQSICYNTQPSTLTQITSPTGGSGVYTYQWQSSTDGNSWSNIQGATSRDFTSPQLTTNTHFRRSVTSSGLTLYTPSILVTVDSQFSTAQLKDNISIYVNTGTNLSISISGGTSPYHVEYSVNGVPQPALTNYTNGQEVFTGILAEGTYLYTLISVTDSFGCQVQSLGSQINVTVTGQNTSSVTNKAIVFVNSGSQAYYPNYTDYLKPYLDWFGVPYDTYNVNGSGSFPVLTDYALIIFGHRGVYDGSYPIGQQIYPIAELEVAISSGVGLFSFDPQLFNVTSSFNAAGTTHPEVFSSQVDIVNTIHYITQLHTNDAYDSSNNTIPMNIFNGSPQLVHIWESDHDLVGATTLASMSSGGNSQPLLEVANFGSGKIVKWTAYVWAFDTQLGPVHGMDDLVWRGIVWAAKKPFVIQGLPPMITMRMDDVDGSGTPIENNLEWLKICNNYGFIPWCGTFTMSTSVASTLRTLINGKNATASPHAFSTEDYIYYNVHGLDNFDPAANVQIARDFYAANNLPISKYMVPHAYLIDSDALNAISSMGIEFIGSHILPDQLYNGSTNWLSCGPYRINRTGNPAGQQPVFYGGNLNYGGFSFFISVTEIRDDGGYEWYPTNDVEPTTARGVRHLRRALNSMVLPVLFTHEYLLANISLTNWNIILSNITSAVSGYNPEYKSMDDAVQYIRAKENIEISNVAQNGNVLNITCFGLNDRATKCFVFTESGGGITFRLVTLPQVFSLSTPVTVGVLNN